MKSSDFSDRLNNVMRDKKIKQIDLVKKTGLPKGTISNYVKGKYVPKHENLMKIAHALDVPVEFLTEEKVVDVFIPENEKDIFYKLLKNQEVEITGEEQELLEAYRKADQKIQKSIRVLLAVEDPS